MNIDNERSSKGFRFKELIEKPFLIRLDFFLQKLMALLKRETSFVNRVVQTKSDGKSFLGFLVPFWTFYVF